MTIAIPPGAPFSPNQYKVRCHACPDRVVIEVGAGVIFLDPPRALCRKCYRHDLDLPQRIESIRAILAADGHDWMPFQLDGVEWLSLRRSGLLADDQGLGKTLQALAALSPAGGCVVVCPAVAKSVWMDHVKKYRPDMTAILAGTWHEPERGQVVVTNYRRLMRPIEQAAVFRPAEFGPLMVIVDEAHYAKDPKRQRTQKVAALTRRALRTGGGVWGLTGTPLKNRPPDLHGTLWALALDADTWPNLVDFRRDFGGMPGRYGTEWVGSVSERVPATLRRVMLRREKRDVLADLPPKRHERIVVTIDAATRRLADAGARGLELFHNSGGNLAALERTMRDMDIDLDELTATAVEHATEMPGIEDFSRACAALAAAKLRFLNAFLDDYEAGSPTGKMLVWSRHRTPVIAVGKRPGWNALIGGMNPTKKDEYIDGLQKGSTKGLAITCGYGMTALTLTAADRAVFLDRPWAWGDSQQCEDRNHRIGQVHSVLYTDIVADHSLDDRLFELHKIKKRWTTDAISAARVIPALDRPTWRLES